MPSTTRRQSEPAVFCIHTSGPFPKAFSEYYGGFSVETAPTTGGTVVTEITGSVADQTSLLSLLQYLDDTGLVLLSIESTKARTLTDRTPSSSGGNEP